MDRKALFMQAFENEYGCVFRRIALMTADYRIADTLTGQIFTDLVGVMGQMHNAREIHDWLIGSAHTAVMDYLQECAKTQSAEAATLTLQILTYVSKMDETTQFIYLCKVRGCSDDVIAEELKCRTLSVRLQHLWVRKNVWKEFESQWRELHNA